MDNYARKEPNELLRLFTLMHNKNELGSKYVCEYIKGILENKGYNIVIKDNIYKLETIKEDYRTYDFNVVFDNVKDAMLYNQLTGNNDWVVMSAMDIGRKVHESVFGENKENVLNKEKKMKNILIKFENRLLVNYVLAELAKALDLTNTTHSDNSLDLQRKFIMINNKTILKSVNVSPDKYRKEFVITSARNADIIIEEVIKEYNKVETKTFNLKCAYNNGSIPVIVYPDKVSFNNEYLSFDKFIQLRNSLVGSVGGFCVGGDSLLLLTHSNTGTKVFIDKEEFKPIVDAVLCRL
jgi:hypothetical protein